MTIHIIKLVVGIETLDDFAKWQETDFIDFYGQKANTVYTRYKPKRADEIVEQDGSIYRVIKNRIVCRQKILGFDMFEHPVKGQMCLIATEPTIHTTIAKPKRPFQGWRYLKAEDAPKDKGVYIPPGERPPPELEKALSESGLL